MQRLQACRWLAGGQVLQVGGCLEQGIAGLLLPRGGLLVLVFGAGKVLAPAALGLQFGLALEQRRFLGQQAFGLGLQFAALFLAEQFHAFGTASQ